MLLHRVLALLALAAAGAAPARGQVSTETSASILVFPKIVYEGSRDTLVQIVNGGHSPVHVRCWYINGALTFPEQPPGPINPPLYAVVEFSLALIGDQPTSFTAARGRPLDAEVFACSEANGLNCYGAGSNPGDIPAMPEGFTGELRCVETDAAGFPINGNHLSGDAALVDAASGDATRYSAIGIRGGVENDGDSQLRLGDEYEACPQLLSFDHTTDDSEDTQLGVGSTIENELTLTTCSANLASQAPAGATVQMTVYNELAQRFSLSTVINGWRTVRLADLDPIFRAEVLGVATARTQMRASSISSYGILGVAEERHRAADGRVAAAATNLHTSGTRDAVAVMTLP